MSLRDEATMRNDGDGWLSIGYIAQTLNISTTDVRGLINAGVLEGFQFGRVTRVRKSELNRYLEHWRASHRGRA